MKRAVPLTVFLVSLALSHPVSAELFEDWCPEHFSALEIAAGMAAPGLDVDNDRCSNLIEYFSGTDPRDPNSSLQLVAGTGPQTIIFPMASGKIDIEHEVVVSDDLSNWQAAALHLSAGPVVTWDLDGFPFAKVGVKRRPGFILDSDQDGLDDFFEQSLVDASATDAITHIGEVLPTDDFDGNGTTNLDEAANAPQPPTGGSFAAPGVLAPSLVASGVEAVGPPAPSKLVVHTPLR